jgi:hypothetical protein
MALIAPDVRAPMSWGIGRAAGSAPPPSGEASAAPAQASARRPISAESVERGVVVHVKTSLSGTSTSTSRTSS